MFLLRPRPFHDESLSSWRQRLGFANGFWRFPQATGSRSLADPDRFPTLEEQKWISEHYGIDQATLASLCLEATLASFQVRSIFSPRLRWLLAIGEKRRPSLSGPMFCPECLKTDEIPYFRVHWRYAFLTECPEHKTPFLDACPGCGGPIWPASFKHLTKQRPWHAISTCPLCDFDLKTAPTETNQSESASSRLWEMVSAGTVSNEYSQMRSLPSFFDGLWSLCQLLLRSSNRQLLALIPSSTDAFLSQKRTSPELIDGLSLCRRRETIAAAYWLMANWPEHFLSVATKCGLSKVAFLPTAAVNPPWLTDFLDEHLTLRRTGITKHEVTQAIDMLQREGKTVSKSAVRRFLGVCESNAINAELSRRKHARVDELMVLLRKFEHQLTKVSCSRDQQATLVRDYLIFMLSVLRQESVSIICQLSATKVVETLQKNVRANSPDPALEQLLCSRANVINNEYKTNARPRLLKDGEDGLNWFIGRQGTNFAGHTLRERIAKMMHKDFPDDLWRSCDAFINILKPELTRW